jgi:hypothetical protein
MPYAPKIYAAFDYLVTIIMYGWSYEDAECGRRLLDNLRGPCGVVTDWQCQYDNCCSI